MLLRNYFRQMPGKQLISYGMTCMLLGVLITVGGLGWINKPIFAVGLFYGLAGVLAGLSIILNVRGMLRLRQEQD